MLKLITTNSYFNLFPILNKELQGKANSLEGRNIIFCEEKISLMVERQLLAKFGGTFNTEILSFGKYLTKNKTFDNALNKEGSAMVVKRVLSNVPLTCFKASRTGLAPSLYDLIIQLKSAKVTPLDLQNATKSVSGALKNKLSDIALVFDEYERFIKERGLEDQSSILSYLPEVLALDESLKNANVYLIGYTGWTSQLRSAISVLMDRACNLTAVLTEGDNPLVFVNETAQVFKSMAKEKDLPIICQNVDSEYTNEGKILLDNLFSPKKLEEKYPTEKVFLLQALSPINEIERVGEVIRSKVNSGECRYRDVSVAVPNMAQYGGYIQKIFSQLNLPCYVDQKRKVDSHPLVRLILSYINAYQKNMRKLAVQELYKNPLFCSDKGLTDKFDNYVEKYNVDYNRFKKPFKYADENEKKYLEELNILREKLCQFFDKFSVKTLLEKLEVKEKLVEYGEILEELGESEEKAVNNQIYDAVVNLLDQMSNILQGVEMSLIEYKNVFLSGVSAMELSILPQYNDAVFVGGYKECGLVKSKYLFACGLTSDVPNVKEDVALLSDGDISALEQIKVLVEPKIKVINHRSRENASLAVCAFEKGLYLSYPLADVLGAKTVKSQIITTLLNVILPKTFPQYNGYLTFNQGLNTFARSCGEFAEGKIDDFTYPSTFYSAVGEQKLDKLLRRSNKEVKIRLDAGAEVMDRKTISPTRIENYYACPYKAFLSGALNLKTRAQGNVDGFSIGNVMHEIFCDYAQKIDNVTDKQSSDNLVNEIAKEILKKQEYERYLAEEDSGATIKIAIEECGRYCYKHYLSLKNSGFSIKSTEASFGFDKKAEYPALDLGDNVKLTGKIDRIDESDKYYRVLDYKTVSPKSDLDLLFIGKKMQLYLYALAVKNAKKEKDLVGMYYVPVSGKYIKEGEKEPSLTTGITLEDEDAITEQDKELFINKDSKFLSVEEKDGQLIIENAVTQEGLSACLAYAEKMSKQAIKQMKEGVIVASPCDDKVCGYCDFRAMCIANEVDPRKVGKVDVDIIINSVKGDE